MITLIVPSNIRERIIAALKRASIFEIGGVLMGEHLDTNIFCIREATVQRRGSPAYFFRNLAEALPALRTFFRKARDDYARFNYLGEWHSHPLFSPEPSNQDDLSMFEIVKSDAVGALFACLVVVKLDDLGRLVLTAHAYLPHGSKERCEIVFCDGQ